MFLPFFLFTTKTYKKLSKKMSDVQECGHLTIDFYIFI